MGISKGKTRKNTSLNSRLIVFICCLGVSFIFWFLVTFNNFFTTTISLPVKYVNFQNDLLVRSLPDRFETEITGTGYELLSFYLRPNRIQLVVDGRKTGFMLSGDSKRSFITTFHSAEYFNLENTKSKILKIKPDTLFFDSFDRVSRKVPVSVPLELSFEATYGLKNFISITPDSAIISGNPLKIDSIAKVLTDPVKLNNLNHTFEIELPLLSIGNSTSVEPEKVVLKIEVEHYTENTVELPVTILNAPVDKKVKAFPERVTLKYQVGLSRYTQFKAADFEISADFNSLQKTKNGRVALTITKSPTWVKNLILQVARVELIVTDL